MKQTMKKLIAAVLSCICVFAMVFTVSAAEAIDEEVRNMLSQNSESIIQSLTSLEADKLEEMINGKSAFEASAATAWESAKEDVGRLKTINKTDLTKEEGKEVYTTSSDVTFENYDAVIEITYDMEAGALTTFKMDVDYPIGKLMADAAGNTVLGIGTVFIMLVFLTGVISLFGVFSKMGRKKEVPASAPVAPVVSAPVEEALTDDTELVAVIAAAIAASENTSTDSFVVRSIKKVNKSRWQRA